MSTATPVTAILIDDEADAREVLRHLLQPHADKVAVIAETGSTDMAYQLITEAKPDLVFLDIQMPKQNGFALLKRFERIDFEVVFVTSYEQYALDAIKFNALDYLVKPLASDELANTIKKAHQRIIKNKSSEAQIMAMLESLEQKRFRKIAVHVKEHVHLIDQRDILYIEAKGAYSSLVLKDESYLLPRIIKDFELYFGEHSPFIRISKSIMVNTSFVTKYGKGDPCTILLTDGSIFEISRRKKQEVIDKVTAKLR